MCVCVCVRERERERDTLVVLQYVFESFGAIGYDAEEGAVEG